MPASTMPPATPHSSAPGYDGPDRGAELERMRRWIQTHQAALEDLERRSRQRVRFWMVVSWFLFSAVAASLLVYMGSRVASVSKELKNQAAVTTVQLGSIRNEAEGIRGQIAQIASDAQQRRNHLTNLVHGATLLLEEARAQQSAASNQLSSLSGWVDARREDLTNRLAADLSQATIALTKIRDHEKHSAELLEDLRQQEKRAAQLLHDVTNQAEVLVELAARHSWATNPASPPVVLLDALVRHSTNGVAILAAAERLAPLRDLDPALLRLLLKRLSDERDAAPLPQSAETPPANPPADNDPAEASGTATPPARQP